MSDLTFQRLSAVVAEMRKLQPNMSIQTLQVFMEVAANDGISSVEIRKTGIPQPTISRALGDLGDWAARRGETGLRLVRTERDLQDQRNLVCFLTPTGKLLANHMMVLLHPER